MKIRVPEYFKDFKCIASKCEDTCCAGWGIVIDDATYDRYKNVQGEFGDRLRSEIVHEAGENIFVLKGNNCPFLNEEKKSKAAKNTKNQKEDVVRRTFVIHVSNILDTQKNLVL